MLTRRHIRIKVLQSVYSFAVTEKKNLADEVKFFTESTHKTNDLYLILLGLFIGVTDYIEDQLQIYRTKKIKDEYAQKINRLASNGLLVFFKNNTALNQRLKNKKFIRWDLEFVFIKEMIHQLISSPAYDAYAEAQDNDFKKDVDLILFWFKEIIAPSDYLYDYLEDRQITWIDDLPVVNTFLLKAIKKIHPDKQQSLPFPSNNDYSSEIEFGKELLEKTIGNDASLQGEIEGKTPNWDPERIALMDRIILKTAIAELLYFPLIPTKVTLNEYLEIAKDYSTPKSFYFVNGVLDKLVRDFDDEKRLNKTGRGLI